MEQVSMLAEAVGVSAACEALGMPRSRWYRLRNGARASTGRCTAPGSAPRALSREERSEVRQVLNSERFQDAAPREVYAALLDEQTYLCSWRTMYRVLAEYREVRERRNQLRHPHYAVPQLLATAPNQVWSWDITKLLGPTTWTYYYLYVMLDIFSRYVVGWLIAEREAASLAQVLIAESCAKQGITKQQLIIHADRGSAMTAKAVAQLLADLGITKTHSRLRVSNDNPYSEAQFKTMKYRPDFPGRFGSPYDARGWARCFFNWYNHEHYHTALGLLTPADVHYGRAPAIIAQRQEVLRVAYEQHPERFVQGLPKPPQLPQAVWINPPKQLDEPGDEPEANSAAVVEVVDHVETARGTRRTQTSAELCRSPQPASRVDTDHLVKERAIRH
jgi:putative transposase